MYYNIKPKSVPKGFIVMCFHPFGEVVLDNLANLEVNVFDYKLEKLVVLLKHQVLNVLNPFFFKCIQKTKGHNIFALILDLKYKNMHLIIKYMG